MMRITKSIKVDGYAKGITTTLLILLLTFSSYAQDEVVNEEAVATETAQEFELAERQFFSVDHALLKYDENHNQLEIFALIDRGYIATLPEGDGIMGQYEITFSVYDHLDSLLIGDRWIRNDWSPDSTSRAAGQKIPELVKYVVRPGDYKIKVRVADTIAKKYNVVDYPLSVELIPSDSLGLSDVIIASKIQASQEEASEFDHNGLLVLPNADRMFGLNNPQLFYYVEIYNLTTEENASYTVRREILNANRAVVKPLPPKDRIVPSADIVEADAFSVSTLRTGSYIFQLTVTDQATGQTVSHEKTFWVFRHGEKLQPIYNIDPESAFAAMSDEEVDKELKMIKYIMSERVQDQVEQIPDPKARRAFLASFWKANDPDTSTVIGEYRQEYLRRIKVANERFSQMRREGWKSDRGRVLLMNGEPDFIQDHPFDAEVGKAYQIWEYDQIEGGVYFVFVDRNNYGDYIQVHSTKKGELNNRDWQRLELGL